MTTKRTHGQILLSKYVAKVGGQKRLAQILSEKLRPYRFHQPDISKWVTGRSRPSASQRLLLAQATDGAIPAYAWEVETTARGQHTAVDSRQ